MNRFQITYILVFIISLAGIAGNMDLDNTTPIHCWLILITSGILTLGKLIYLKRGK